MSLSEASRRKVRILCSSWLPGCLAGERRWRCARRQEEHFGRPVTLHRPPASETTERRGSSRAAATDCDLPNDASRACLQSIIHIHLQSFSCRCRSCVARDPAIYSLAGRAAVSTRAGNPDRLARPPQLVLMASELTNWPTQFPRPTME